MPFTAARMKKDALDRICQTLNIHPVPIGPGSTEPIGPLIEACRQLGLSIQGSKPVLAERIATSAGLAWDRSCDSRETPSGGGSTVTLVGLNRVLEALERRSGVNRGIPQHSLPGDAYKKAGDKTGTEHDKRILIDLSELDRATRLHAMTQNRAAEVIRKKGLYPMSPGPNDPQFDLAWRCSSGFVVAEVKTVQPENYSQQVRLGLGQVLEYRHCLTGMISDPVLAVLILSAPPEKLLRSVCRTVDVIATEVENMDSNLGELLVG